MGTRTRRREPRRHSCLRASTRGALNAAVGAIALAIGAAHAADPPNLEGVWGMVQH